MKSKYFDTDFITGLRAIAVMMVFFIHSRIGHLDGVNSYLTRVFDSGRFGVQIFFVISGFTIFYQFIKSNYNYANFMKVRFLRITTAYYPVLLIMFFVYYFGLLPSSYWNTMFNGGVTSLDNLIMHATFLGGFNLKYINTIIQGEWTLYVEMFFYVLLGLCLSRAKDGNLNLLMVISFTAAGFMYFLLYKVVGKILGNGIDPLFVTWLPFKYMLMFVVGGYACILRYRHSFRNNIASDASFISLLVVLSISPFLPYTLNELLFMLATFFSILFMTNESVMGKVCNSLLFRYIGSISFSFYLWHGSVLSLFEFIGLKGWFYVLSSFMVTIIISSISYNLFEVKIYSKLKSGWMNNSGKASFNIQN